MIYIYIYLYIYILEIVSLFIRHKLTFLFAERDGTQMESRRKKKSNIIIIIINIAVQVFTG